MLDWAVVSDSPVKTLSYYRQGCMPTSARGEPGEVEMLHVGRAVFQVLIFSLQATFYEMDMMPP